MTWEYAEEYAKRSAGWTELLNRYADDGWRFVQALPDDTADDGSVVDYRLIFERKRKDA